MSSLPIKRLGCLWGNFKRDSATVSILSIDSGNVTVTVGGRSYVVALTACGTDRVPNDSAGSSIFGYSGSVTCTLLQPFTKYAWTLTQGANTVSGFVWSAPEYNDDFAFAMTTCLLAKRKNSNGIFSVGPFGFLHHYLNHGALPLITIMHSDDLIYADFGGLDIPDANLKSKSIASNESATVHRPAYDFAYNYGHLFGIAGGQISVGEELDNAALGAKAREVLTSVSYMPMWGDHEFQNNLGWSTAGGTTAGPQQNVYPNARWASAGVHGPGRVVYDQLIKPLHGTSIASADTESYHYKVELGCVNYVAMDSVTKAVSDTTAVPFPPITTYGTNQITDVLTALDTSHAFKILNTDTPLLRPTPTADVLWMTGINTPDASTTKSWQNFIQSEYDRLMVSTGLTPKSVMNNPKLNGTYGELLVVYGDWHTGCTLKHKAPSAAGKDAENFVGMCLNTLNMQNGSQESVITSKAAWETDNMELLGGSAKRGFNAVEFTRGTACVAAIVEVYGSRTPKEMIVRLYDVSKATEANRWSTLIGIDFTPYMDDFSNFGSITDDEGIEWRCTFERKFVQWTDNAGHAAAATPLVFPKIGMRSFG